jgi:hypothetical protein
MAQSQTSFGESHAERPREQDRLEAYQPLITGQEIHLRGRGTPDDWEQVIQLVEEDERRSLLFRSDGGQEGTQIYNLIVDLAEKTGLAEPEESDR